MRGIWTGLGLLLVVPWLTQCTTGRLIRLETGEGPPLVYTPAAPEPPPIEIPQQVFLDTLTDLLLTQPLTIHARPQGRIMWASWGATQDTAQQLLLDQCEPSESADDCLRLPSSAPPPGTLSRMRLAFSLSLDSLWEGATIPMAEYADPMAFKVMVYSAMITWLVILMAPEPVTKALAALLTLCLVAYIGLGPVWSMMKAGWQFAQDCERATTAEQLKLAGQRFNLVLGDNGMRIFLLLATAAIGGRASFLDKGPRLPAFSRAVAHASKRTGVNLRVMAQVRTVALAQNELVIGLAPTAVAAVAMGPPSSTGRPATTFETAQAGGKHSGFLRNYQGRSAEELRRGIASLKKQIAEHQDKIANPQKHIPEWSSLDARKRDALVKHKWPEDIQRQTEQLEILESLLKTAEGGRAP
jgi:hypothetical protein